MNLLRQTALSSWYYGSLPYRWVAASVDSMRGQSPVMVLFYHRVADQHMNDWTISTDDFIAQMKWLRERFDMVSLEEAQRRVKSANNSRPAVSITFDDGYAENMESALPWLIRESIPVTYFVSSGNMLSGEPFPHDVQAGRPLKPNTQDEIRQLADQGVEIGAHTRTHADLGALHDETALRYELLGSVSDLEHATGGPIQYFAFPFGLHANLNDTAFRIAHESGLKGVCSAYGGYNRPGDDAFHLQRIHGDREFLRLKNWVTVDPRKSVSRYVPQSQLRDQPAMAPV